VRYVAQHPDVAAPFQSRLVSLLDLDNIIKGCNCSGEELCIKFKCCVAAGETQMEVGVLKEDGMIVKLGAPCCSCGIKVPAVCVAARGECLCIRAAASLPFDKEFVGEPVCAICAFQVRDVPTRAHPCCTRATR
jgi:hypothetical protein